MYKRLEGVHSVPPSAFDHFPIYWNGPGWGSVTDRIGLQAAFGHLAKGDWAEALLVGIKPNGIIPLHTDAPSFTPTKRHHFVLSTNPACWCFHDGTWEHLPEGSRWEMDETLPHAAVNFGTTTRYHLIVDLPRMGDNSPV